MRILIITPAFNPPHGGLRVIVEWANRLTQWHDVTVHSLRKDKPNGWIHLSEKVKIQQNYTGHGYDCLIITSPHSIEYADRKDCPPRVFLFMQMAEHLFRANDKTWYKRCEQFYKSPHPMFCISKWNITMLRVNFERTGPIHYIGNGVNTDDFPIEKKWPSNTILVEGWEPGNVSKDIDNIGPKVAKRLRDYGFQILAYSHLPLKTLTTVPHEYYERPSLEKMNELYRRASIMIKATKFDARSCAPVEAMTKGTVTCRAIIQGDDDLIDGENSLRVDYNEDELFEAVMRLSNDAELYKKLSQSCVKYVTENSWDKVMSEVNQIISKRIKCKTVIISVVYLEQYWQQTKKDIEACNVPVVYVDRRGAGSLAEAINRGFREACIHYDFEYVWFVTNIYFGPSAIPQLEEALDNSDFAAVHPSFDSDHRHLMKCARVDRAEVPFIEFTAACVRREIFERFPLDENMPYWGHDLDWGMRVRESGLKIGVDYNITVEHTYIRNTRKPERITQQRATNRRNTDEQTRKALVAKYGADWRKKTGLTK